MNLNCIFPSFDWVIRHTDNLTFKFNTPFPPPFDPLFTGRIPLSFNPSTLVQSIYSPVRSPSRSTAPPPLHRCVLRLLKVNDANRRTARRIPPPCTTYSNPSNPFYSAAGVHPTPAERRPPQVRVSARPNRHMWPNAAGRDPRLIEGSPTLSFLIFFTIFYKFLLSYEPIKYLLDLVALHCHYLIHVSVLASTFF